MRSRELYSLIENENEIEGIYVPLARRIKVKKSFCGHVFDHDELKKLLNGEEIKIEINKKEFSYYAVGSLQKDEYKGFEYWNFVCSDTRIIE